MTFEQPKHLNIVTYQRVVRAVWPIFLFWGGLLSSMMVFGLWRRAAAGEHVAGWRWIGAAGVGFLLLGLIHLGLLFERSRRRYVELRGDRFFLAQRGAVAIRRFITWSLSPDPIEPRYTRLQLIYRFGFGRKRWSMLLDDASQIAELRDALTAHIPQRDAAQPSAWSGRGMARPVCTQKPLAPRRSGRALDYTRMKAALPVISALVVLIVALIFWYRWDTARNRGHSWGYWGEFNAVSNALATVPGVTILSLWYNADVTLEEFGFDILVQSRQVKLVFGEKDPIRRLSGQNLQNALSQMVKKQSSEPGAPPNGGPAKPSGNSEAGGGPPSVS
jgi:hypothetical protein